MKRCLYLFIVPALVLVGCKKTADEEAAPLLAQIEALAGQGEYKTVLDSIESLRRRYPKAKEARRRALALWQQASLKMAQDDIARTDSALQQTLQDFSKAQAAAEADPTHGNLLRRNRLGARRDSLQARYDAMCALVRVIRQRQKTP